MGCENTPCQHQCVDTVDSYYCLCFENYVMQLDQHSCLRKLVCHMFGTLYRLLSTLYRYFYHMFPIYVSDLQGHILNCILYRSIVLILGGIFHLLQDSNAI